MKKIEFSFPSSCDGVSVAAYIYEPEIAPRAILQISHGMCEYIGRYENFAEYLCGRGILVCGNDHIGHGGTAATDSDLGYIPRIGGGDMLVEDLHRTAQAVKERYPDLPHILLGHSMGSFAARIYGAKYGEELDGLIIMGTGGPDNPTAMGKAVARLVGLGNGGRKRSKLIDGIAFGSYCKRFTGEDEHPKYAWLTRDREIVDKYAADKFCSSYLFTADGFYTLFDMIGRVSGKGWAHTLPKALPTLVVSGAEDPVGDYGRGVKKVYDALLAAGLTDLTLRLYPTDRHEILNELDRNTVYAELAEWLDARV